jgi:hypothetical protein
MDRQKAMEWWNNLSFEQKYQVIIKNKEIIVGYPDRNPSSLTGREIEQIFENEK